MGPRLSLLVIVLTVMERQEGIAKHTMTRIHVDFNCREDVGTIAILRPQEIPEEERRIGAIITLYEPGIECEAILRRGERWEWVADILDGTIREVK